MITCMPAILNYFDAGTPLCSENIIMLPVLCNWFQLQLTLAIKGFVLQSSFKPFNVLVSTVNKCKLCTYLI